MSRALTQLKKIKNCEAIDPLVVFIVIDRMKRKLVYIYLDEYEDGCSSEHRLFNLTWGAYTDVETQWFEYRNIEIIDHEFDDYVDLKNLISACAWERLKDRLSSIKMKGDK